MKATLMIIAASIFMSINIVNANPTQTTLTFWDAMGNALIQPIMSEEEAEAVPAEVEKEFESIFLELIYRAYDLSELTQPEEEEELPFDLETVFRTLTK